MLGLQGWQWLFIIEGLPPIVMCFVTWMLLTDRPKDAAWLTPEQRTWLQERLDSEQAQREAVRKYSLGQAFRNPKIWLLTLAYVGQNVSSLRAGVLPAADRQGAWRIHRLDRAGRVRCPICAPSWR